MGGSSGKSSKKQAEPAAPTVATNPNYIAMQQPAAFAPGMQQMLSQQLAAGYGSPAGLLGPGASAQDFNGLLSNIYSPEALAADPIGVAQNIAAATTAKLAPIKASSPANTKRLTMAGSNSGGNR